MRVLLLEPYFSGSHAAWASGYARHSRHEVELVSLEGRFWRWRLRAGAAALAEAAAASVHRHGPPDVLVVSSMTDLAVLLGLSRRVLGSVPVVHYMHENQLAYPRPDARDVDAAVRSWMSMRAADHIVFNSHHHRRVVAAAVPALAALAPEPTTGLDAETLLEGSSVVPVGIDLDPIESAVSRVGSHPRPSEAPLVVWNHRWDPDKQPHALVSASLRLTADGLAHEVALLGDDAWRDGARRADAVAALGDAVVASGHLERDDYLEVLARADIVASAARHEFFGVAVVEAIAAGCVPVLPDRLSYPEIIPREYHEAVLYPEGSFRRRLAQVVADPERARRSVAGLSESMSRFAWPTVARQLDEVLDLTVLSDGC